MRNSRKFNEIREVRITRDFCASASGSVLIEMGNTRVICAVSISTDVPDFAVTKGMGWITAEYTMLPYSTSPRVKREFMKRDGRSVEIQRLIGRSLRTVTDLVKMPGLSASVDCDVLNADGGTRTASITGASIALQLAFDRLVRDGRIESSPMISKIAAISVGSVHGELLLDLDYSEDSKADIDMNLVMDENFNLIEIQGTGEGISFPLESLYEMIGLAKNGIKELFEIQNLHFHDK